jgi:chemotaxis response regulator CheB
MSDVDGIAAVEQVCRNQPIPIILGTGNTFEVAMKTQGEIEAAICEGIARFEQEYMGRGPKDIHAHLIGDLLVVRLQGVLTAAEQQLVKSLPAEKGQDLLKQVRTHLIETARPVMEAMSRRSPASRC